MGYFVNYCVAILANSPFYDFEKVVIVEATLSPSVYTQPNHAACVDAGLTTVGGDADIPPHCSQTIGNYWMRRSVPHNDILSRSHYMK